MFENSLYKTRIVKEITLFCCHLLVCLSVSVCRSTLARPPSPLSYYFVFLCCKGLLGGGGGWRQVKQQQKAWYSLLIFVPYSNFLVRQMTRPTQTETAKTFQNTRFKMVDRSLKMKLKNKLNKSCTLICENVCFTVHVKEL
jgi:hypothetical protein